MCIQNRKNGNKFSSYIPLQIHLDLISLKLASAYFAYTKRYGFTTFSNTIGYCMGKH